MVIGLICGVLASSASGQTQDWRDSIAWRAGSQRQDQLRREVGSSWSGVPLREVLDQFSQSHRISLFLDRRVDPGQMIELQARNVSVFESLQQVLDQCGLSGCWMGDVYYIASPNDVGRLILNRDQLLDQVRQLPESSRRRMLARGAVQWPRLSRPHELLGQELAADAPDTGPDALPHDLWPEFSGPPLSKMDRLLMLVHGFDKQWVVDGSGSLAMTDVAGQDPAEVVNYEFRIPATAGRSRSSMVESVRSAFPDTPLQISTDSLSVRTTPSMIARINQAIERLTFARVDHTGDAPPGTTVVSVQTRASMGRFLATAAANLNVTLEYDPALRDLLERQIDLSVKDVTYAQLIEQVLAGTGLEFDLDENRLLIRRNR